MLKFSCPHCAQSIEAEPSQAGAIATCPTCGGELTVPDVSAAEQPAGIAAPAAAASPYAPPRAEPAAGMSVAAPALGGLRRLPYFLLVIGLYVVQLALTVILAKSGVDSVEGLISIAGIGGNLVLAGLRLKNIGGNPWWCLLLFVPFANIYIMVKCLAFQEGYEFEGRLDSAGRLIVGLVLGSFVLLIVLAVLLTMLG